MRRDTIMRPGEFSSSLLSCEKDAEIIIQKLFLTSKPYSDYLKRLLVINTPDALDNLESPAYKQKIKEMTLKKLKDDGYIKLAPKIDMHEHQEVKSYIILTFDRFRPTSNDQFRDCVINFDIMCHVDQWDMGDFRVRPLKIAGYIDGILNRTRLTGIGTLEFAGLNLLLLNQVLGGYTLTYRAVHGSDDKIPKGR